MVSEIRLFGIAGIPEVRPGDSLSDIIVSAAASSGASPIAGDLLVVAQKVVSKSEGRLVRLRDVDPSDFARTLAKMRSVDPRFMELVLRESRRIVRMDERVIVAETHHGLICANAGIDRSNIEDEGSVSLLPLDPDASARRLRDDVRQKLGFDVPVIISDTFGRPWREGLTNVAIGLAGFEPLCDFRFQPDDFGRALTSTVLATADEIAAAAGLIMRKTQRTPIVLARGIAYRAGEHSAIQLLRAKEHDLFR